MKKIICFTFSLLFILSFQYLHAQWARTYGGGIHGDSERCIQQTSDGGYVIAGEALYFGPGSYDIWILKLDSNGDIEWQRAYGGSHWDRAHSIQQTSDGGYIVAGETYSFGAGSYDFWILKLGSDGDIEWQRAYGGGSSDYAYSIQQTSDDGYIVAGETRSFGAGSSDFWILKLDSNGDIEWQRTYGGSSSDCANSIQQTNDGGYIVAGESSSFSGILILKLDADGDIEWQRVYVDSSMASAHSIQQTSDGGYIAAGEGYGIGAGGYDFWVLKLDADGDIDWQRTYGGSDWDKAYSIQQTSNGGYIVAGETESFGAGGTDFWVLKLDSDGDIEWQQTYGGTGYDKAYSVMEISDEVYIVAGEADSFDGILVLKLYSDGYIDPSCDYLIGDSNAYGFYSSALSIDTNISPEDTTVSPLDTGGSAQVTNEISNLLCGTSKYILTISNTPGGTTDPAPGAYPYVDGTEVTIEALPGNGYEFSHWSGDVPVGDESQNPVTVTLDSDKSIKANFSTISGNYELIINTSSGGTTDPLPGSYSYPAGTDVDITPLPDSGSSFSHWSGDVPSGQEYDNPLSIDMDSDKSVTPHFNITKTWTFMVYLDGDNNLEEAGIGDFLEMAKIGSDDYINIVVQFDRRSGYDTGYGDWTSTKRFYVTGSMTPTPENAVADLGELNHGDPNTLIDFVSWAKNNYPANNYALILWNHGGGWREPQSKKEFLPKRLKEKEELIFRAVCWDDTDGEDCLYMDEVQSALNSSGGANLIGFDACLMGMVEVAYEMRNNGEVMVGSEETEPFAGWPYTKVLLDLTKNPEWSSLELGQAIVDRYYESYTSGYTQSAIDLSKMDTLASAVSSLAQAMIDNWDSDQGAVRDAAQAVMTKIDSAVIHEHHGSSWPGANGLAVYFPKSSDDFSSDYNGTVIDFPGDTQWEEFLNEYHISMQGSWIDHKRWGAQQFSVPQHIDLYNFCYFLNTEPGYYYTESSIAHEYIGGGTAWNLIGDDVSRSYSLPFDFPYFKEVIPAGTPISICTNGFINFEYAGSDFYNSGPEFTDKKRIAPCWTDMRTNGGAQENEDIYITENTDHLIIRWVSETYRIREPVNVELILYDDGRIQFNYDGGNADLVVWDLPTIGISKGDGINYYFAVHNGQRALTDVDSVVFAPIPSSPENPSPAHEATNVPADTDLNWDDCVSATSYDVYFGSSSPPPYVSTVIDSAYDPGALAEGTTYYWKIVAKNDYEEAPGEVWQFTTCQMPGAFFNLAPSNGASDVSLDSDLDWEDSTGAASYDVYFGTTSPPPYLTNVTESYYDPGALVACSTYYWKIVAKNVCGEVHGEEWNFATVVIVPQSFSNLSPADEAMDVPLDSGLDWEDSSGAASYDVYFGTTSPPPYVTTVNESFYDSGSLNPNTTYHWYVVAKNSCGDTPGGEWSFTTGQKFWTFMVYLDADNNLESAGIDDFLEMASVGSDDAINIVVQFDRISGYSTSYGDWTSTKRFYITNGLTPDSGNEVEDLGELNHGDPQTLIDFVDWAKMNYPADRYALILWNHGGGWRESKEAELRAMLEGKDRPYYRGVCWDDTDGGDYLYTDEVQSVLNSTGGAELIGFDACLMAMGEVAYEIRNHGEVMVGSEETEPGDGWPYDTILQDLANNPSWSSSELGQAIVDRYFESYASDETQSAIDLSAMDSLASTISTFAQNLINNWDSNEDAVKSAAQDVMTEVENSVIHEQHGPGWPGAHGLAIYFPSNSGDFESDYNGTVIDFADDTQWDEFLQEFYNSMGGSWIADARAMTQDFTYPQYIDLYDFCYRLVHEPGIYYTEALIANEFLGGGTAQNVQADDNTITYSLPFDFPYFGEVIPAGTNIYICTNGFVDLETYSTDFSNTVSELITNKRIAVFWEDLATNGSAQAGEDIYITEDPGYFAVRWIAETLSGDHPVNFELIMYTEGRIQFNYDGGNDLTGTSLSPTIGISKGDGAYYNLSVYNEQTVLTDTESNLFIPPGVPDSPASPSPSDLETGVSLDTELDWDDCIGATSYDVYFGSSSPPLYVSTVIDSAYDPGTLAEGTTYYWKIVAKNDYGETPGKVWQFTTCQMPGTFFNLAPSNGASDVSLDSDLDWEDSTGAASYDVYFGTISPPPYLTNVTESYYDPGALVACSTYYWKIVAKNVCGEDHGEEWSFATVVIVPQSFSNLSPADEGMDVPLDSGLDWEDSSGAASYDVYFGTSSPPPYVTTVNESFYDSGSLNPNTTYHWYVVAKNSCGDTPGVEWSFTTCTLPGAFNYLTPSDGETGIGLDSDLEWNDSSGATSYDVYFGTVNPPPYVETISSSHFDPGQLNCATQYFWRVIAVNNCGTWEGGVFDFTTMVCLFPDLIIDSLTHSPLNPSITDLITFTAVVKNTGDATAGSSHLEFKIGDESSPLVYAIPSLDSGDTYPVERQETLSTAMDYLVTATADINEEVAESDETNNEATDTVSVHGGFGSLTVTIEPQEVIDAGAQWKRLCMTTWQDSGHTESDLPASDVIVEFKDIEGWLKPANQIISIPVGDTALITASYTQLFGSGIFTDSGQNLGDSDSRGVALGDIDGDGDLDAFVANRNDEPNKVWLNDGSGIFTDSGQSLGSEYSRGVALRDVDGDGDLDAFVANSDANIVWLNDGNGTFTDSGQSLGDSSSHGVALGDIDCDGDIDAFVVNPSSVNKVWLNDGSGTFTDSGQSLGDSSSYGIALGDVDFDGDLDAFVANYNESHKVWLNDGSGIFSDSSQNLGDGLKSRGVALGDVDGDGDLDAFVANQLSQGNGVWLNDGSGTFTDSGQSLGSSNSIGVALGDVDGDGDIDALIASFNGGNKVWLNDGAGTFTDSGQSLGGLHSAYIALGDVDGDSGLDAFVANALGDGNKVWMNTCLLPIINGQPQSQTIDYNTTATLSVTASSASLVSYQWYQGDSGDTSTPVGTDSDSYTTPNLTETISYWVRVSNDCGSTDSDTATVSVLPSTFANFSPADTSTDVALDTDLDWEDSTGATSYDVYLGTISPPPFAISVSESYYDPGGLGACETYYWKIVAKNDSGDVEGPEWSFATIIIPPESFSYLSPSDFATEVPLDADLDWEDSTGAASYDVYLGTTSPPPYVTTVNESYYDPGVLNSSTTYYWSVIANNSCGNVTGGEWSFTTGQQSWTFMVYLDADNNLESAGIDDFLEMATVGSNDAINIVVQFDRIGGYSTSYGNWTTTKRFYITNGLTPNSGNEVEDLGELNHGDPQTLIDFVDWAKTNYPAERYALVLWNHGGGWRESKEAELRAMLEGKDRPYYRGVCWDDTDGGDYLYTDEVQNALNSTGGAELIGFDACLMAMGEVAYEIRNYGEVMVGSEETEPGDGWPYDTILQDLTNNPGWSSSELGQAIVDRYYESYASDETQSAIDLSMMDFLAGAISTFAQSMIDNWNSDESAVRAAAQDVMTEVENAVIREQHGSGWPGAHGLAIYFPSNSGDFESDYNGTVIDFADDTQWDELLQEFYSSMGGSWIADARAMTQDFTYPQYIDLYDFCYRLVHEPDTYYVETLIPNDFLGGGTAQGVHADDSTITYSLPFDFPYFGEVIPAGTNIYICTNGFIDLETYSTDFSNTVSELIANKRIAAFWEDLATNGSAQAGEDIYITEDPGYLAVRWLAETLSGDHPVNFELIMHTDGRIQFNYDGGNDLTGTTLGPTIGISKGDGAYYNLSVYNGEKLLTNVESDLFSPPGVPGPIADPSPSNLETEVSLDTELDWDDCIGATSYDIYFGSSSPPPYISTVINSYYEPGTLAEGTTYYWRVVAKNDYGETPGDVWQFTTCNMPGAFSNLTPSSGASDVSLDSDLDWEDSSGATSYDIYFGTTSPPPYLTNVTESYYDPGALVACSTYYWKIVAKNNCGEVHGEEWSFATVVIVPQSFSNLAPADEAMDVPLDSDLDWEDSSGAASYDVYFGTTSPPPYVTTVNESFYDPGSLNPNTIYHWYVIAKNSCGDIQGDEWSFTTASILQHTLTINSVEGGTTDPAPGDHTYDEGTEVTIGATPDNGFRFTEWTGDVPEGHETDNPLIVTMNGDKTVTANFIRQYTLILSAGAGGTTDPSPGTYTYDSGIEVTITPDPEGGYGFSGWTGNVPSGHENDNPLTLTMDSDKSITANFLSIAQYTLTIVAGQGGTTDPVPGSHAYDSGTAVTVTAKADTGYRFGNWSGDVSSTNNTVEIIMNGDKTITANFIRQYTLTVAVGSGGTTDPSPGNYTWDEGTEVTIEATPDNGYRFTEWTGNVPQGSESDNPLTLIMDSDKSIEATFIRQYELTISAGTGGTIDPSPGSYIYDQGTGVTVTAQPESGYEFSGWTGDVPSGHENDNPLSLTMDSDKSITATFLIPQCTLTIIAGEGGTTNPAPGSYTYNSGTAVTVACIAETGCRFENWSGDVSSTDNPVEIIMDGDKTITANFIRQHTLTLSAGAGGTTSPSPGTYTHDSGTNVTLRAIANNGYEFSGWSGDASGTDNPVALTMDSDKSIAANFRRTDGGGSTGGDGDSGKKSPCFIATAAYGSPLHPHIDVLRDFRDRYLMPSKLGRMMVECYYRYSPSVADFIAKHKIFKVVVRANLLPLVAFSYSFLHFGPIIATVMPLFIFGLPIFLNLFFRRKTRQKGKKETGESS